MAKDNSPIRAKGIGKTAKRHDLDGTPGLQGSSLQYGDVSAMEAGQKAVQPTVNQPPSTPQSSPVPPTGGTPAPMVAPDPVAFAQKKLAGTINDGVAGGRIQMRERSNWLPFLERIAASPTSSGILQRAYIDRLSREMRAPIGGDVGIIRQREMDERLRNF